MTGVGLVVPVALAGAIGFLAGWAVRDARVRELQQRLDRVHEGKLQAALEAIAHRARRRRRAGLGE